MAKAPTKSEIVAQICKDTELSRKEVGKVFDSLNGVIRKRLRGGGLFTARAPQDEGREEAGRAGARGHQPFHPTADHR